MIPEYVNSSYYSAFSYLYGHAGTTLEHHARWGRVEGIAVSLLKAASLPLQRLALLVESMGLLLINAVGLLFGKPGAMIGAEECLIRGVWRICLFAILPITMVHDLYCDLEGIIDHPKELLNYREKSCEVYAEEWKWDMQRAIKLNKVYKRYCYECKTS